MTIFEYAWIPNFFERIGELKALAMQEDWDYKVHPTSRDPILTNYVKHTFYCDNPADLIYDTRLELRSNVNHIVEDNIDRFPSFFQGMDEYQQCVLLGGTIEDAKRRIRRNYKTAIPQYYKSKIQLLLPICLTSKAFADLALVVERQNDIYRASTCLTLDMALNNARLIARPDDEWLIF